MPLSELQIVTLVEKYLRERDRFEKMASVVVRLLSAELRAAAVPHVPTFRSKDPESLSSKLSRDSTRHEFTDFDREFAPGVLDLAGARIMLYRPQDAESACTAIERVFAVPPEERYRRDFLNPDGYLARHRVVALPDDILSSDPAYMNLDGVMCEIQVVTFGDHIWNELQHDILYKTPNGQATDAQAGLLLALKGQLNAVRMTVERLMDETQHQRDANLTTIETPDDLSDALRSRTGRRLHGNFDQLLKLLAGSLMVVTRGELERLPIDPSDLSRAEGRLQAAGLTTWDDVSLVIGALWPNFGEDFLEIARSWRGRPGPVSRLLQSLAENRNQGII